MLYIPSDTEELARRIARETGKTPEAVIRDALDASARSLGVVAQRADADAMIAAAEAVILRYRSLPLLDERSADEILGYDEHGLPA